MDWNFRIVKYLDELVQQLLNNMVEETAGVEKQNSWKGFKMSEHACSMEGVFWVSDSTASPYLKMTSQIRKFKARQSSNSSESDKQKSLTCSWGSLA